MISKVEGTTVIEEELILYWDQWLCLEDYSEQLINFLHAIQM